MPKLKKQLTRVRTKPVKKWTESESLSILHYILDKQNDGRPFEKPTAEIYYDKLKQRLEIMDVSWQQLKAKITNFRTKFVQVKKWLEGTGQGVDSGTIEDYQKKKCQFYYLLHGIFAAKANITIPYKFDSLQTHDSTAKDSSMDEERSQVQNDTTDQENPANTNDFGTVDANFEENTCNDLDLPVDYLDYTLDVIGVDTFLPLNVSHFCFISQHSILSFLKLIMCIN